MPMPWRLYRMLFKRGPAVASVVDTKALDDAFEDVRQSTEEARAASSASAEEAEIGRASASEQRRRSADIAANIRRKTKIYDRLSEEALSEARAGF